MLRRDQFVERYSSLNNINVLQQEIVELEQYVDSELLAANNILSMINQDQLTLTQDEDVMLSIDNESIHNDKTVLSTAGRKGGVDDVEYAIWNNRLLTANQEDATITPWLNKRLSSVVDGTLSIVLPKNTNKNAAKLLVDKYLGPTNISNLSNADESNLGFWRKIPQLDGTLLDDLETVKLVWDNSLQLFKMIFKLNS